eukprot:4997834-Prymnesium_polylepis.2
MDRKLQRSGIRRERNHSDREPATQDLASRQERKMPQSEQQLRHAIHKALREREGWLLIVDNVDEPAYLAAGGLLERCLPPAQCRGHVLVTSILAGEHQVRWAALGVPKPIRLARLSPLESEVLLLRAARGMGQEQSDAVVEAELQRLSVSDPQARRELSWLAGPDGLAGFPLALTQAGKYLGRNSAKQEGGVEYRREIAEYCGYVRHARAQGADDSVRTTWERSFERLQQEHPATAELLACLCFLASDHIPLE